MDADEGIVGLLVLDRCLGAMTWQHHSRIIQGKQAIPNTLDQCLLAATGKVRTPHASIEKGVPGK